MPSGYRALDHPRRCGENVVKKLVHACPKGSPPQVRGKRMKEAERDGYLGITPAGAGKTRACCRYRAAKQDHPRRCGENFAAVHQVANVPGSPPQVRGKH